MNQFPDGSVLFCSCTAPHGIVDRIAIRVSGNDLVHAAVILGDPNVLFEQTWPRACNHPLTEWIPDFRAGRHGDQDLFVMVPNVAYTPEEVAVMLEYAKSQMGRKYQAKGAWKHTETRGTYCSQFVSEVLEKTGRIVSLHYDDLPSTLYTQIEPWSHRVDLPKSG